MLDDFTDTCCIWYFNFATLLVYRRHSIVKQVRRTLSYNDRTFYLVLHEAAIWISLTLLVFLLLHDLEWKMLIIYTYITLNFMQVSFFILCISALRGKSFFYLLDMHQFITRDEYNSLWTSLLYTLPSKLVWEKKRLSSVQEIIEKSDWDQGSPVWWFTK